MSERDWSLTIVPFLLVSDTIPSSNLVIAPDRSLSVSLCLAPETNDSLENFPPNIFQALAKSAPSIPEFPSFIF